MKSTSPTHFFVPCAHDTMHARTFIINLQVCRKGTGDECYFVD